MVENKENLRVFLERLITVQTELNSHCYFVGGCVRDCFYEVPSNDYDIAIDGDLSKLIAQFDEEYTFKNSILGTAKIKFGAYQVDLAEFRSEVYTRGNGLPDVYPGSIKQDLNRRDFTINTGYVHLNKISLEKMFGEKNRGDIELTYSHSDFLEDIKNRKIRILHERSFIEDPSRLMRAVKYMTILGLKLEEKTRVAFQEAVDHAYIDTYSEDRFKQLLLTLARHECGAHILENLFKMGVLMHLPHVSATFFKDVQHKYLSMNVQFDKFDYSIVLLLLLYEYELEFWLNTTRKISSFSKKCSELLTFMNFEATNQPIGKWSCYKYLRNLEAECLVFAVCSEQLTDKIKTQIKLYITESQQIHLKINGEIIKDLGIPAGKQIGTMLDLLLEFEVNSGNNLSKEEEIKWIESYIYEHRS